MTADAFLGMHPNVELRMLGELTAIKHVAFGIEELGYSISRYFDGEEEFCVSDWVQLLGFLGSTDEESIVFINRDGGYVNLCLVWGNAPEEVFSDWWFFDMDGSDKEAVEGVIGLVCDGFADGTILCESWEDLEVPLSN